uniref:Uncharacterized protein n=1 Tax=Oryza glaberrima TaxID=4538 RepID=I1Q6Q6_ORYGL
MCAPRGAPPPTVPWTRSTVDWRTCATSMWGPPIGAALSDDVIRGIRGIKWPVLGLQASELGVKKGEVAAVIPRRREATRDGDIDDAGARGGMGGAASAAGAHVRARHGARSR